jgi:hypothetical protein
MSRAESPALRRCDLCRIRSASVALDDSETVMNHKRYAVVSGINSGWTEPSMIASAAEKWFDWGALRFWAKAAMATAVENRRTTNIVDLRFIVTPFDNIVSSRIWHVSGRDASTNVVSPRGEDSEFRLL